MSFPLSTLPNLDPNTQHPVISVRSAAHLPSQQFEGTDRSGTEWAFRIHLLNE